MTVTLRDARISSSDQEWIRSVYRSYLSELSVGRSGLFPALGEWPAREEEFLAGWLQDPAAQPFVILLDGQRAGFALVVRPPAFPRRTVDYRMAEFYVADSARRRGVGAAAAALLFARFSGEWEVLEDEHNRGALGFWRRVISAATQGRYAESRVSGEVRHQFRTTARPAVPST
ncbi:MAG: GNAT family N-acetyltransferase [Lysobacterales bacterium]|nr:MAG: GNAT family N-acetyltransferase [Xanthomonadales bacterium]